MKIPEILVEIVDLKILVHSNGMVYIKRGRLGLDPLMYWSPAQDSISEL